MALYLGTTKIPHVKIGISAAGVSLQEKTVTPSASLQIVNPDSGYTGLQKVTVNAIPSQYIIPTGTISINSNGIIDVSSYSSANVNIATSSGVQINNQNKSVTPQAISQTIEADVGYTGLGTVIVDAIPSQYIIPNGNKSITANGNNIDVAQYATVSVNVSSTINTQSKTVSPTESQQTITPDSGYNALSQVTVNAISSTYVGTGVTRKTATTFTPTTTNQTIASGTYLTGVQTIKGDSNLTAANIKTGVSIFGVTGTYSGTGSTVSLQTTAITPTTTSQTISPASGYDGFSSVTVNAMPTMTLPTTTASTAVGTLKATVSRSTATQYINIPTGYNATSATYKINGVANGTVTAPSTISSTGATVTTGNNTITFTKTVSVTPNVTSAGYISAGTAGNSSISLTASITTKAATTFTPGTTNQTISSATYLTGTQTILGDADLVAANIKTGVNIFGVAGSYTSDANAVAADLNSGKTAYVNGVKITGTQVINKFYTGSSAPSSSLGSNGDIYLQE